MIVWPSYAMSGSGRVGPSLLDSLLSQAPALTASLSNIAKNMNAVDGSISIHLHRNLEGLVNVLADVVTINSNPAPMTDMSSIGSSVNAMHRRADLFDLLDPSFVKFDDLASTSVGTLQSGFLNGDMNGSFYISGRVSEVLDAAKSDTAGTTLHAQQHGSLAQAIALQNISVNSGSVNSYMSLTLVDVNATLGMINTTAIGALQSGTVTADVTGGIGQQTDQVIAQIIAAAFVPHLH